MQDTALVALFTGTSSAIAVALGAGWQVLGENLRARHERQRRRDAEAEARERRLRRSLARTRAAVLRLAVSVRVCADIRASQRDEELTEMLAHTRDTYYQANVRIEALRTLVSDRPGALDAIDELLVIAGDAYAHVRSSNHESGDPRKVEDLIRQELRRVSEAVLAT
jgi:hypothetical protein